MQRGLDERMKKGSRKGKKKERFACSTEAWGGRVWGRSVVVGKEEGRRGGNPREANENSNIGRKGGVWTVYRVFCGKARSATSFRGYWEGSKPGRGIEKNRDTGRVDIGEKTRLKGRKLRLLVSLK